MSDDDPYVADLVVLGSGVAGLTAALTAVLAGSNFRIVGKESELALIVDAKTVRPLAGQVEESDLLWFKRVAYVEDKESGSRAFTFFGL